MYDLLRVLHSVNRWLVLSVLVVAVARAVRGWRAGAAWTPTDERVGAVTSGLADLQMLLGLLLYALFSPLTRAAFRDFSTAMADDTLRFWLLEHAPVMLVAVVLVHVGKLRSARRGARDGTASTDDGPQAPPWSAHRMAATWYGMALIVILAAIPWPFLEYGRPLLPWG